MGVKTNGNGQIQPKRERHAVRRGNERTLEGLLSKMSGEIARALPKHVTPDRMSRVALTALRTTPKLAECSPASFLGSVISAAQLGLEPNTPLGHCYLIPRRNRGQMECTLMVGYQGMLDLARRSGMVSRIYAFVVREGDDFRYQLGLSPDVHHVPAEGNEDAPITHAYAVARLKEGDDVFVVLPRGLIEKRRKRGASGRGVKTPWDTDYEAMATKTAIRALFRYLPKSSEMARAEVLDDVASDSNRAVSDAFDPEVTEALRQHDVIEAEGEAIEGGGAEVSAEGEEGQGA